ncbi:MAG TPA: Mur ligase domain-containing protein [Solirubrobacteraceae bacterium]|jgi:UDP-N-acetylmuramate--alanine ligase|nr:Mur ligase domain-containing protein [Solirubrobacteraceae bacterium]
MSAWSGRRLHVVGIAGAGMSAYAIVCRALGATVTGSDRADSPYLARVREAGISVTIGHAAENVPPGSGVEVVVSTAIPASNPEVAAARSRGLRVLSRADLLAELTREKRTIAVAGAHGKTTTSSMVAHALIGCGLDPSYVIGGTLSTTGTNAAWGSGEWLVVEADESDRSFLALDVDVAVVTNIELDHHTEWPSLRDLQAAFADFLAGAPVAVLPADDPGVLALRAEHAPDLTTALFGPRGAGGGGGSAGSAEPARPSAPGGGGESSGSAEPARPSAAGGGGESPASPERARPSAAGGAGESSGSAEPARPSAAAGGRDDAAASTTTFAFWDGPPLAVPGEHNRRNAAAALEAAVLAGADRAAAAAALATFRGAGRRFETLGRTPEGAVVVDDYAHHPTEVAATIAAARERGFARVVAAFQPHLYSRTQHLARRFGEALATADVPAVLEVYPARERAEDFPGVTGRLIAEAAADAGGGKRVLWLPDFDAAERALRAELRDGDVLLVLGAGDVDALGRRLVG